MSRHVRPEFLLASLFALCSTLSGCIDSRGIHFLSTPLNDSHLVTDEAIRHAQTAAHWPQQAWWQAYGDPQLNAWVQRAQAGSPTLAMAQARVRQALAIAGVAESAQAPQVDLDATLQRKRWPEDNFYGPGPLSRSNSWNNTSALGLSFDLDLWGGLRSEHQRSLDLARVSATEARAAALELEGNVVRSYILLAQYFAELDIAQDELTQRTHLVELAKQNLKLGLGTQLEVSQAETPLPEARRQVDLAHEAIALTRNQLAALAGQGPGAGSELKRPSLKLQAVQGLPSSLPMQLLGQRPDVVARRWEVSAAARGIEVAKAEFYPNINLLGSLGTLATQGNVLSFLSAEKFTAAFGPALNLPIFDGGRRRGQLSQATAGYDVAVEHYNQTLVQALQGVSNQLIRLHSLEEQREFVAHSLHSTERSLSLAQLAHERGLNDYRSVLQAQTEVFAQQRLQQQILAASLSAQADLWIALGGGVQPGPGPAEDQLTPHETHLHLPGRS